MGNKQMKQMMKGAVVLSVASLIAKVLSAVYRVPFQNMVGNTGFYVYQQVYPIYGIGMTFALSGFPIFLSKLIAETKHNGERKIILKRASLILTLFAIVLFLGIYTFSDVIANGMGDSQLAPIVKAVSWMFLLMPGLVVWRGYFQGTENMIPTAISQVVEQIVRVAVILIAAALFLKSDWSEYRMGTYAMSSAWIAGIAALFVMMYYYYLKGGNQALKEVPSLNYGEVTNAPSYSKLFLRFLTEGSAICILSALLILLQLIDSFTLFNGLMDSGVLADEAKNLKGIYDRGQPLVQLGMVVGTGFASSLIPMLTKHFVHRQEGEFYRTAVSLLRITTAFAMVATAGMLTLMPFINDLLFGDRDGNAVLSVYILAIIVASLIGAYNTILQSRNQHRMAMLALVFGLLLKWGFNQLLIGHFGTMGASIATVFSLGGILLVLWLAMPTRLKGSLLKGSFLLKLVICCWIMTFVITIVFLFLGQWAFIATRSGSLVAIIIGISIGVPLFVWLIFKFKLFTIREWLYMPFGKRIVRIRNRK